MPALLGFPGAARIWGIGSPDFKGAQATETHTNVH